MSSVPRLGVPLMDRDHALIAELLATAGAASDVRAAFDKVETAIVEHFAGEEALMREADIPILHCHLDLHAYILSELRAAREALRAGRTAEVAAFLQDDLPQMIVDHVASADTVSAGMLRAHFGDAWTRAEAAAN